MKNTTPSPLRCALKPLAGSIAALLLGATAPVFAGSDTWKAAPGTGDWNTTTNWVGGSIPNSGTDTATFFTSNIIGVSLSAPTTVSTISFSVGASAFTITVAPRPRCCSTARVSPIIQGSLRPS